MKTISLRLEDKLFQDTEKILSSFNITRNVYINQAIESYNKIQTKIILEMKLKFESNLVRNESMEILDLLEKME